jgi:5-dehydro-2-deoxygluconokinase
VIEAFVMGQVGIDLYPNQLRTPLRDVRTYTRFVGGFAGNVSTGLARLGVTTAIVSRVGANGHGVRPAVPLLRRNRRRLPADRPDLAPTPPTFCEAWPPDHFPITFYRRPTCPDWQLAPEDFDADVVVESRLHYATGTGLAQPPSRETTLEATGTHRGTTIFDLDWRPALWERADEYPALAAEAVSSADILIGNEEEVAAAELEDVPVFVIKRGEHGATVHEHGKATDVPRSPVDVINGLGAGDAFAAAVGHGLLRGHSLVEAVRRGTVAGALVAVQLACSEAMPRLGELEAALA